MKKKKILISGCSFSQSQVGYNESMWIPYSDLILHDFDNHIVTNLAMESRGNGYIIDSIVNHIEHSSEAPNYIIVQLSAFTRFMHNDINDAYKGGQVYSDLFEYIYAHDYADVNSIKKLTNQTYLTNFVRIKMLTEYLKNTSIPHFIFFGWNQLGDDLKWQNSFNKIINNNPNFWIHNKFNGMLEYGIDLFGKKAIVSKENYHPTTIVHDKFYKEILKPRILNEI